MHRQVLWRALRRQWQPGVMLYISVAADADNPEKDEMLSAIEYCHLHGVKIYMTVNTLLKDREMDELYPFLKPYYEAGLDAVIVQTGISQGISAK